MRIEADNNTPKVQSEGSVFSKTIGNIRSSFSELLKKPSNGRHHIKNHLTDYLDRLEDEFKGNDQELEKIRQIVCIDENHLLVGGFIHKVGVCSAPEDRINGIFKSRIGDTLFRYDAGMEFAGSEGYLPYSKEEMKKLLEAIPGDTNGTQIKNILRILEIPFYGYLLSNGNPSQNSGSGLLTSSCSGEVIDCFYLDKTVPESIVDNKLAAMLLLVHKKSTQD